MASPGLAVPKEPHQPLSFKFPKRQYGLKKPVFCSFKGHWFTQWPFLHYNQAEDIVLCHTFAKAFLLKRIKTSHNASETFVS